MAMIRTLVFFIALAGFASTALAGEVLKIKPRDGVFLKMLAFDPGNAKAVDAISAWIKSH